MASERVLVGPDRTGHALLVLPAEQVVSDLKTLSALLYGQTFGEVRADAGAAALLDSSCEQWVRRLQAEDPELTCLDVAAVLGLKARANSPFPDAVEFFGDDWDGWRPEPRLLTEAWLREAAPEVLRWIALDDDGWGFDYTSSTWLAREEETRLIEMLHQRGYCPVATSALASCYDDVPRDVDAWLRAAVDPQSLVP